MLKRKKSRAFEGRWCRMISGHVYLDSDLAGVRLIDVQGKKQNEGRYFFLVDPLLLPECL